ncbi:geranylgeranyl reductase family protein [archaeon]|nr:geranylgeranyl reductase family protein [archaeon]
MECCDVLIVGAGSAGSTIAKHIAKKGYDVILVDSRENPGTPQQCSGLFSKNILELTTLKKNEILKEIKGAVIYSPSKNKLEIKTKKTQAYVVDRTVFDYRLAIEAKSTGAILKTKTRLIDCKKNTAYFSNETKIKYKIIVGADGPNSTVAKIYEYPKLEKKIVGIINLYDKTQKQDFVELYLGNKVAPGFFAWKIPRKTDYELGIATELNTKKFFEKFKKNKTFAKNISTTAGVIPLECRKITVIKNSLLVGDAAGHTKATTGGGVVMGMRAATIAANCVCDALKNDNLKLLKSYEKLWRKEIGRDLKYAQMFRKFLNSLNDKQLDKFVYISSRKEVTDFLKKHGDMDYPNKIIKKLILKPRVWLPYVVFIKKILNIII